MLGTFAGGNRNAAYLVERRGERFVAKTTRRSEAQLRWLTPLQEAARQAGFLVPALIPAEDGRLGIDGWTLEPFLPGEHLTQGAFPELLPQLEAYHWLTGDVPQRPGFAAARDLLNVDAGGDLAALPLTLREHCRDAWRPFADAPLVGLHGDLLPGNLLRHPSGAFVLLDWDEARRDGLRPSRAAGPGESDGEQVAGVSGLGGGRVLAARACLRSNGWPRTSQAKNGLTNSTPRMRCPALRSSE